MQQSDRKSGTDHSGASKKDVTNGSCSEGLGIVNHRFTGNWHILKTAVKSPARVKEIWEPYGELDGVN